MARSDLEASGVMFTMDTESGFADAVFITSSYGLGEGVVQGAVNPDEFYVYKPALRAGRPAILKRGVGGKATKMVYSSDVSEGTTKFVSVAEFRRGLKPCNLESLVQVSSDSACGSADRCWLRGVPLARRSALALFEC
jgi:pyruvate,water dikinase